MTSLAYAAPPRALSFDIGNANALSRSLSDNVIAPATANIAASLIQHLATLGGNFATPIKVGSYLYVPSGAIVTAWNYDTPKQPQESGDTRTQPANGVITNIVAYKSYLYAGWNNGVSSGIAVYSLANPAQPGLVKQLANTGGANFSTVTGVGAAGGYLYVFDDSGMSVNALNDPVNPRYVGMSMGENSIGSVVSTAANHMMTSGLTFSMSNLLSVYDVSHMDTPTEITHESLDGLANYLVQFAWPRAVGFGQDGSVNSYRLSATGGPVVADGTGHSSNIMRSGFVTNVTAYQVGDKGVDVWDLGPPVQQAGHVEFDNGWAALTSYAQGQIAWVVGSDDHISALTLESPNAPRLMSSANITGGYAPADAAIFGNSLLLLQQNYGVGVARTDNFLPLARFDADLPKAGAERDFEEMSVKGHRAYLDAWGYGLIIVDFSDPIHPRELGRFSAPFFGRLTVQGRYAYLGRNTNGGAILSVDVSNPAKPLQLDSIPVDAGVLRLQSQGTRLFVATARQSGASGGGLLVFDVSNPAKLIQLGAYSENCNNATDLALSDDGNIAYLRCNTGLHIIDVSHPDKPVLVGFYPSKASAITASIALSAGRVYMSGDAQLEEIDVRNQRVPVLISTRRLPSNASRLRVTADGRLYAFVGFGGMQVFTLKPHFREH
ncbi:hypothetical protein EO087_01540 [Dyella sp. M7H15-1]|uniref:hypothetical protein n=1 Tax=Dyella sp. M7H15-1 TaxID=2501295 RepID=UPI00100504DD|nr:hypothetical protein [Dyella sp. M7H15-1]QAU22829.1 hypothetical protein EO087_01540 [Dyella sp. M7H15-1]